MDLGLKGKKALVTGGSTGLGFAVAQQLVAEGATVCISSRNEDKLAVAQKELGGDTQTLVMDLGDPKAIEQQIQSLGPVDILVNNTGGPAAGDPLEIDLEAWDQGYQSLLRSVIQLCRLLAPGMEKNQWGRILTITSSSAKEIIPRLPVSSTFRSGLTGWTKELAKAVGRKGILVNNLLPGPVGTARLDELKTKSPDFYKSMTTTSALGRVGRPEEVGKVAAFLCSDANGYITGTNILVDGGYTAAL